MIENKQMNIKNIKTLGELKKSGYKSKSIKEEIRENLIKKMKSKGKHFSWHYWL